MKQDKPQGFFGHLGHWLHRLWLGARRRCPRCQSGAMFESYYEIHKKCPECGVTFQPYEGDILGVIATAYFLTVVPALVGTCLAYAYLTHSPGYLFAVFMGITSVVLLGGFPSFKGMWVALVYLMTGFKERI